MDSNKYDEQLNQTSSSIKNKLFEITKKSKEFKFQQNLRIKFNKNQEAFKSKIFADPWLDSEKLEFNDTNINELLDIQHNQLSLRVERWTYEGAGWTKQQLIISEISPCEGSSNFHYLRN